MKLSALAVTAAVTTAALLAAPGAVAAPGSTGHFPNRSAAPAHRPAASGATPAAEAFPNSYNNACGAGYKVVGSLSIRGWGNSYLTYNSSTGYNCAVTVRSTPGGVQSTGIAVRVSGKPASVVSDSGMYTSYAGPVYLATAGKCVDWWGWVSDVVVEQDHVHCG